MSTRSITPSSSCSEPIGISVATTCWPKACLSESRLRKKSARSRSSMFTKMSRARPSSSARCQSRSVVTSTPITPLTTNTAPSHTRSEASASARKLGSPGVSTRLILRSSQRNDERLAEIDISRVFSSERGVRDRRAVSHRAQPVDARPPRTREPRSRTSSRCPGGRPRPRCGSSSAIRAPSRSFPRGSRQPISPCASPRNWRNLVPTPARAPSAGAVTFALDSHPTAGEVRKCAFAPRSVSDCWCPVWLCWD